MANRFTLSWTVGDPTEGGNQRDPGWSDVARMLERLKDLAGTLTLEVIDGQEMEAQSLQLRADHGHYLVTLGADIGKEYEIRSSCDPDAAPSLVSILGDLWDSRMVISEFDVVISVFEEFFNTGDVSHQHLN